MTPTIAKLIAALFGTLVVGFLIFYTIKGAFLKDRLGLFFLKLLFQGLIFFALVGADGVMFYFLLTGLEQNALTPEVSALMGSIVTAITGGIGLAAKDFFNEGDAELPPGNGEETPPVP